MHQKRTAIGRPSLATLRERLTGQDPRSVKAQVLTAAGVLLASYLFFFVFTRTAVDADRETGNIIGGSEESAHLAEGSSDVPPPQEEPGALASGIDVVKRVAQGVTEGQRRKRLAKLTQRDYEQLFSSLEPTSERITKHIESGSGKKARFELRYRAFAEVVAAILKQDSSTFTRNRKLASHWHDVKTASAQVYRISFHPVAAGYSGIAGIHRTWYTDLMKDFYPDGEGPNEYPSMKYLEAIAAAKERLFDQQLTEGEYEDVVAADAFARDTIRATTKAHLAMDAFHAALKSMAKNDDIVKNAIRPKEFSPGDRTFGFDWVASLRDDYDIPVILDWRVEASDHHGRVDFLSRPPRFYPW